MYVLGIAGLADIQSFLGQHFPEQMMGRSRIMQGMDAAAALLCDGNVIAAASEERFDRIKKSGRFPIHAIDYCLATANISIDQVDHICGNFNFGRYGVVYRGSDIGRRYWQECLAPEAIKQRLVAHYKVPALATRFRSTDHHLAHLHAALASAPFNHCLAIVTDAAGEIGAQSVYHVGENSIELLRRYPVNQSLGMFYSLITHWAGFAFNEDEYKIMGMAALGDPNRYAKFFKDAIVLTDNGGIEIPCLQVNDTFADRLFFRGSSRAIEAGLGFNGAECSPEQRADVSAGLQRRFTQALFHICRHFQASHRGHYPDLLLSGGCAENCMTAGELRTSEMFRHIHIAYASGDEGTALGAAAACSYELGRPLTISGKMPFFGPAPDQDVVRELAAQHGLSVVRFQSETSMLEAAADEIAHNRIIALCHGRMEYGARALGNRSLLALPSDSGNKERINAAIKKRESYRPFAPAVLLEEAHEHFELEAGEAYPYMTMLTKVRKEAIDRLPAIVHFDGTARVQTVDREHNPAFYHFLTHLKRHIGMGVVLNTSYNVNHQPIVCTEQEAIETFMEMGIDALFIAQMRVTR